MNPVGDEPSDPTGAAGPGASRALCLSGGGFRAAIFHLGAMLRLHELGVLRGLDLISSVSGGSIASAWLASSYLRQRETSSEGFAEWCDRTDFKREVVDPFREIVARDLRTFPVLATLAWNWLWPSTRVNLLRKGYQGFLGDLALLDLPAAPRFVFCATNLTFGVNWEFSRQRVGDFQTGYLREHGHVSLATAVAASSCFPPLFGPLRFAAHAADFIKGGYRGFDGDRLRARVELSDGGVYDNMGTEPALKTCGEILVSDAGAPFAFVAGQHYFRRLLRYAGVVGNQAVALRKRLFFRGRNAGEFSGAYWNLADRSDAGAAGYSLGLCSELMGAIRTDLDRFTGEEFCILVNHGYFSCEDGMPPRGKTMADAGPAKMNPRRESETEAAGSAEWPYPEFSSEAQVRRILRSSHRRFFHRRWWQN
jgi:NTE family protein